MVIGIDYRLAASTHRGMGRYCREIVAKLFELDVENQYILYIDTDCDLELPSNFRWHKLPTSNFILGEQLYLPMALRRDRVDIMWSTSNTFPLLLPRCTKLLVTVHDLIFMYPLPKHQNLKQRIGALYRRFVLKFGIGRVDKVITVSQFSAAELKRIFKIDDSAITYNCIESFYKEAKTVTDCSAGDYYFTLSADAPSKNLPFLLDTFAHNLPAENLVVGGIVSNSPLREKYKYPNITFLNEGVPDSELIRHNKSCRAFIYVSIFEGFGIPPLEALACGAKVICSNATSLPEVIGRHGLLINPTSDQELISAIQRISQFEPQPHELNTHLAQFVDWRQPAQIVHRLMIE